MQDRIEGEKEEKAAAFERRIGRNVAEHTRKYEG